MKANCGNFLKMAVIKGGWLNHPPSNFNDVTDKQVYWMLKEYEPVVELSRERRRHWTDVEVVSRIDDRYVAWWDCEVTGDLASDELGWEFDIFSTRFVERKERIIREVYYE